ncbi:hypothetical protein GOA89_14775 [Sinorhizobium meliloti]|nr:hypothetical protein [Sinorhizobium meliloti]MDW9847560.1 hypothetical protein [Sinorhizobium meliloti]MDX0144057.1 hypothetical protein [Sinorhizobium meliloti]MDX0150482.1 hypothetical protein [Sinorhizobium meliloti]MDX0169738.1 hypothetical protein [Sinorhizobium meliloti]
MTFPSFDTQMAAYQRYVDARRKADQTLLFEDCRDAAAAWIGFVNVYLPEEVRMPERRLGTNVAIFPVHLSRSPSRSPE